MELTLWKLLTEGEIFL